MRVNGDKVRALCRRRGVSVKALLRRAGVSPTAYYALARKDSVLPRSIRAVAGALAVTPAALLDEPTAAEHRVQLRRRRVAGLLARHPGAERDHLWHTLVLLERPPVERLRGALRRAQ